MISLLLFSLLLGAAPASQVNQILPRATAFEIPLLSDTSGGWWGEDDRTADHAAVAINSSRDILVAYHTTRTDILNGYAPPSFHEPLKQVEIAFFEYDSTNDQWDLKAQKLIGSTEHNPLTSFEQDAVRCERPDVIAVGDRFFVVWTRRYDRNMDGYQMEPAVLECAWVNWTGAALEIHTDGQLDGQGFILDDDYTVRECAGVPDAVLLDLGSSSSTVGVVYPHQTDIGDVDPADWISQGDNDRLCDLRLVLTSIDSSNQIPDPDAPVAIVSDIVFDGDTAPMGQETAGIILPDCARGQRDPSSMAFRFWLAYEEQNPPPGSGNVPDGRIKLGLWEQLSTGVWDTLVTLNIGSASNPYVRHRVGLSSHPEDANGLEFVSMTFGKTNTANNDDVVHDEWGFDPDTGLSKVTRPVGHVFENNGDDHKRPAILHGRTNPLVRLLFVDRNEDPSQILEYDIGEDSLSVKCGSDISLGRAAVAYWAGSGSTPDDVVLTWEERQDGVSYERIWIRVD